LRCEQNLLCYECVSLLDFIRCSRTSYEILFRPHSATYRVPPLWHLKQSVIVMEEQLRRNKLTTNHRGELGKDSNQSQHRPDKTRFVAQVVHSNIKRLAKDCIRDSDEGSRSLVDVVYSSGEPLVTKQRMGRGEDTKKCYENSSETYEDIRIFPSLTNY